MVSVRFHPLLPADAETLAWNRAREAEWVRRAGTRFEAMLRELAPEVFSVTRCHRLPSALTSH